MLAITVSDPDLIAIIGLALAVVVGTPAWLNWVARHRNTKRIDDVHQWVRPNGAGTLVEMTEQMLTRVDALERSLERQQASIASIASITAQGIDHEVQDERRFGEAARRMGASEIKLADLDGELAVVARELAQIVAELGRIRGA